VCQTVIDTLNLELLD